MPPKGYSDFSSNLVSRSIFAAKASVFCLRWIAYSCSRQQRISDSLVPNPLKLPSFSLLFQLILSGEPVSPFKSDPLSLYSLSCFQLQLSLSTPVQFSLCFPFFLHPHSLVFLTQMNLRCSFRLSYFLFLCLLYFR